MKYHGIEKKSGGRIPRDNIAPEPMLWPLSNPAHLGGTWRPAQRLAEARRVHSRSFKPVFYRSLRPRSGVIVTYPTVGNPNDHGVGDSSRDPLRA